MIDKQPCEHQGCTNLGFACFMELGDEEPIGFWCHDHCFSEGFCFMCGYFYAGIGSFEVGEGMCEGCAAEVENDYGDSEVDYE